MVTSKNPPAGEDILTASANNLYAGVTLADLEGFTERYELNSRLVKTDAGLVEEVYRVGGRYDAAIRRIVGHLEDAIAIAPPATAAALGALVRFYRTGEVEDRRAYDIAWVADRDSPVDTINGFIEVYLDARGCKGAWEAVVSYVNEEQDAAVPGDRRRGAVVRGSDALGSEVPQAGSHRRLGARHRRRRRGRRLGADDADRHQPAQRSGDPRGRTAASRSRCRTSSRPTTSRRRPRCARSSRGRPTRRRGPSSGATSRPSCRPTCTRSSATAPAWSSPRCRPISAPACASSTRPSRRRAPTSWRSTSSPIRRWSALGLLDAGDHRDIVLAEYEGYARNALVQLRRVREGTTLEEDHMRNRQAIVHWLMAQHDGHRAARARRQDLLRDGRRGGVPRRAAGGCWPRSSASRPRPTTRRRRALFEAHGTHFDPALRDEVLARTDALDLAGLHRLRPARARAGPRCVRRDHRRPHQLSVRLHGADAPLRRALRDAGPGHAVDTRRAPMGPRPRIRRSTTCCASAGRCTPTATPRPRSSARSSRCRRASASSASSSRRRRRSSSPSASARRSARS